MVTKLGKERKLCLNENFRLKYGTVNFKDLKTIFLQVDSWVQPINEEIDFKKSVCFLKKVVYNSLSDNINRNIFASKFIIDLDLRTSGMSTSRRSFMNLEITLFMKSDIPFQSDVLKENAEMLFNGITNKLEQNNFNFKPTKK